MLLQEYLQMHTKTLSTLNDHALIVQWTQIRDAILETLQQGGKLLIAGNGGSAADAQHFAAELVGRFLLERKGYPAIALTTDTSAITSIGNDYGFEEIFSRQIEALGQPNDCFVGITTSGSSKNICNALKKAKEMGLRTITLTGRDGGNAKEIADMAMVIPVQETSHIQEAHIVLYHAWCKSIEEILYGDT